MIESVVDKLRKPLSIAVLAAGVGAAFALWQLGMAWRSLQVTPTMTVQPVHELPERQGFSLQPLLDASLFGAAASNAGGSQAVPETTQNLILRGAFVSALRDQAGAIIEAADGQTRWYRTGSTLPGGAILDDVLADHVLLQLGGRRETLRFPRIDANTPVSRATSAGARGPSSATVSTTQVVDTPIADLSPEEKAREVRARLEELRNRSRQ